MAELVEKATILYNTKVHQLVEHKHRLVEIPYTATVGDTLNTLLVKNILAMPVAAPPGKWQGVGGNMILEQDRVIGVVRKQYIGMVSVLDVLIHVAEAEETYDMDKRLVATVDSIIMHSMHEHTIWCINPHTSVFEAMEAMSKGIHWVLVPIQSKMNHNIGVELTENSPGYHLFTQKDMVNFLYMHSKELDIMTKKNVSELGVVHPTVFAAPTHMIVMDLVKCLRNQSLEAVAIVEGVEAEDKEKEKQFIIGNGKKLVGTFSTSLLLGCTSEMLQAWSQLSVTSFFNKAGFAQHFGMGAAVRAGSLECRVFHKPPVTCHLDSPMAEVMSNALSNKVHHTWVVDKEGLLTGVVSFSDIIRVAHEYFRPHYTQEVGQQEHS